MKWSIAKSIGRWLALTLTLVLTACGGGDGGSSPSTGTLQVALTDALNPVFAEVVISIREIRAVPLGSENASENGLPLIASFDPPVTRNVLELAFQQELLGEALLPAGTYNQVRLVLAENSDPANPANYLVVSDAPGIKIPLNTPSGQQSGLKVLGRFSVAPGEISAIVLDFDPTRAIHEAGASGKWQFKPTGIRIVEVEDVLASFGAIQGTVVQAADAGGGNPLTSAVVAILPENSETVIASGQVNPEDGSFRAFVPTGFYEVQLTAEGFEPFSSSPDVFEVIEGQDTDLGTIEMVKSPATP